MASITFREIEGSSPRYWFLLGFIALFAALGLGAAYYMEHHGHIVTGMNNSIVWGTPHVFAVFLIVAASGALNSPPLPRSSAGHVQTAGADRLCWRCPAHGRVDVLMLDLGRADRLIVAMTYNLKSVFAWNVVLYTGFFSIAVYIWTMMERR